MEIPILLKLFRITFDLYKFCQNDKIHMHKGKNSRKHYLLKTMFNSWMRELTKRAGQRQANYMLG
jgi:hypothetical protein